jgi:hypothetical protein
MKLAEAAKRMSVLAVITVWLGGCATLFGGGAPNPAVGTWDVTVESALGTQEQELVVHDDMSGYVKSGDAEIAIQNAALDADMLTFDISFDVQGQQLDAKFDGTIKGDTLTGQYVTELGNGDVSGTRRAGS